MFDHNWTNECLFVTGLGAGHELKGLMRYYTAEGLHVPLMALVLVSVFFFFFNILYVTSNCTFSWKHIPFHSNLPVTDRLMRADRLQGLPAGSDEHSANQQIHSFVRLLGRREDRLQL
jgi:hypothetical protein